MTFIPRLAVESGGVAPLGSVFGYAGNGIPKKWLLCDGGAYAYTQAAADGFGISLYTELYSVIGQTFAPDIATGLTLDLQGLFMVPDLVGKIATGADDSGSVIGEPAPLGNSGGVHEVTLQPGEVAEHYHYFVDYYNNEVRGRTFESLKVDAFGLRLKTGFGNRRSDNDNQPVASFWNKTGTTEWFKRYGAKGQGDANPHNAFADHDLSSSFYQDTNITGANYVSKWYIPPFGGKDGGNDQPHNNVPAFLALKYLIRAEL